MNGTVTRSKLNGDQPKVAIRLRENKTEILERWIKAARANVKGAQKHTDAILKNALPVLIDKMVQTLETPGMKESSVIQKEMEIAREHGRQRTELGNYSLGQVVHEYQLFRQIIFFTLEEGGPLPIRDRDVLLDAINFAVEKAVSEFSRVEHSNRDQAEDALKRAHAELDERVQNRTKELDQTKTEVWGLEEERNLRENFVSTLSHDLRTPLTAAKTSAPLVGRIVDSIDRADQMIQDLLDANLIRAGGKLPIHLESVNLNRLVQEVCEELSSVHGNRYQVEFNQEIQGQWDGIGVRRILENCMKNAQKYGSPDAKIIIRLSHDLKKEQVTISIHNLGNPIPPDDQKALFAPFHRTTQALNSGKKGWGLGLTLVRGMTEAHGGKVSVHSSQVDGTTFTILLPLDSSLFLSKLS
jgi:signal transduction histidine kinase